MLVFKVGFTLCGLYIYNQLHTSRGKLPFQAMGYTGVCRGLAMPGATACLPSSSHMFMSKIIVMDMI